MEYNCPLCERRSTSPEWFVTISRNPAEIQNEIANLDLALEGLLSRDESLLRFIENKYLMCTMCQKLMEDIEDETSRSKLEERINKQIFILEEQLDTRIPLQM